MKPNSVQAGRPIVGMRPQSVAFLLSRGGIYLGVAAHDANHLSGPPEDVLGRSVFELLPAPLAATIIGLIVDVLGTGQARHFVYTVSRIDRPQELYQRVAKITKYDDDAVLWDAIDISDITPLVDAIGEMSDDERNVWLLAAQGLSVAEIAARLCLSRRTVSRCRKTSRQRFGRLTPKDENIRNPGCLPDCEC